MFSKETAPERHEAQEDLNDRNADYLAQQQIIKEHFLVEQAKKPKSRRLKRIPKPEGVLLERNKNAKGGIDWYRYQTCVIASIDPIHSRCDSQIWRMFSDSRRCTKSQCVATRGTS